MKKLILILLFTLTYSFSFGQRIYLEIISKNAKESKSIDSVGYNKKHDNAKKAIEEIQTLKEKLFRIGYLNLLEKEAKKTNDSVYQSELQLGKRVPFIEIHIGNDFTFYGCDQSVVKLPIENTESFLNKILATLEQKGYALAKIQLTNFKSENNSLCATLQSDVEQKRTLQDIVIKGYEKFPKNHTKNIKRHYKNNTFNQNTLKKVSEAFDRIRFVKQIKAPEILFTKDSTKIYVYLEKTKPNTFDGFIGFTNTEKKFTLNGYLDLKLQNILNSGEKFSIYWKSDGNNQKTFDASTEIPYLFQSQLGIKAQLNIFKQDSIFQNAKTAIDLGYYFNYNTKVYLGYQSTESSDIQNTNNSTISDFNNSFITNEFDYIITDSNSFLFPEKTSINFRIGYGKRDANNGSENQFFANLKLSHNLYLNKKNSINIRNQSYYLKSNTYIINELYRFGGINSIRGFNENSLQGNLFSAFLSEYRYHFNEGLYLHTIIDYGYYQDKTSNIANNLLGLGFGFGLNTKNGIFNFVYANGSTKDQAIKLSNSIVHISFKARF